MLKEKQWSWLFASVLQHSLAERVSEGGESKDEGTHATIDPEREQAS